MSRHSASLVLIGTLLALALAGCKPAAQEAPANTAADANATPAALAPNAADQVAAAAASLNPLSSPKDDIIASMEKFKAVRSYHATMHMDGGPRGAMTNEVDFVAPDRFRMKMPMGTQIIIGDTMYMSMQGRTMKVPMPKGTLTQWRDPANMDKNIATMTVDAQGSESIDGVSARKYVVHHTQPHPADVTMWLADDFPLQIRVSSEVNARANTTTIRYSRINDPSIRIDPPL